jgi:uncharacterized membrane protein
MATAKAQNIPPIQGREVPGGASETVDQVAPMLAGGALAMYGLAQRSLKGAALAVLGGALAYSGVASAKAADAAGAEIQATVTMQASPQQIYRFWRQLSNLPRFMSHVQRVQELDSARSHWVGQGPGGVTLEWDAEIIEDRENQLISWRTLPGAALPHAGIVSFTPAPPGRGTEVRLALAYDPPGGVVGDALVGLFGDAPALKLKNDLYLLRQLLDAGEIISTKGQPSGRKEDEA